MGMAVGERDMDGIAAHGFDAGDCDVGDGLWEAIHEAVKRLKRSPYTRYRQRLFDLGQRLLRAGLLGGTAVSRCKA